MALLSSVFGTALGAAAKVGSEAIRESREADALAVQEFKKNVQAKKEAFAKQQAAAAAANKQVQDVADFLAGHYGAKGQNFSGMELEDLAKQLIGISPKDPQKYFLDNLDKMKFTPKQIMGTTTVDVQKEVKDAPEELDIAPITEKAVARGPMAQILGMKGVQDKPVAAIRQTASMLAPVKKKPILAEILTGKDAGTIQREALASLGMSEKDYSDMLASAPAKASRPKTAAFSFAPIRETDTLLVDDVVETHALINKMIKTPNEGDLQLNLPEMTYTQKVGTKTEGPPGLGGRETDILETHHIAKTYMDVYRDFLTKFKTPDQRAMFAPIVQLAQDNFFDQVAAKTKSRELSATLKQLNNEEFKVIRSMNTALSAERKEELNFNQRYAEIKSLDAQVKLSMLNDANYKQSSALALDYNEKVLSLFSDLDKDVEQKKIGDKYSSLKTAIGNILNKQGIKNQFANSAHRDMAFGLGLGQQSFMERFMDAVEAGDENLLKELQRDVTVVSENLRVTNPNEEDSKLEQTKKYILGEFMKDNNITKMSDVPEAAIANAEHAALMVLRGGEIRKSGKGFVIDMPVIGSRNGESSLIMKSVPFFMDANGDGQLQKMHAGYTDEKIGALSESSQKLLVSMNNAGKMVQYIQQDGLLLGGVGEIRGSFLNFANVLDVVTQRVSGSKMFAKMSNKKKAAMIKEIKQMAISFVSTAKDELFDDPRLSDQDLALVLGYIGVLNTADEKFKLIGPDSAIAALIGLERIFARQRAIAKYIMAGDTGKGPYARDDFNFIGETPEIRLDKDSIAKSMFMEIASSRGIDLNKFGRFDENGAFIGLSATKARDYFNAEGTYGYDTSGKKLTGPAAGMALRQDITSIHQQVHDIMLDISDYGTLNNAEFIATSRTRGTPGTLTEVDVNDTTSEFYSLLESIGAVDAWKKSKRKKAYVVKFS
jgi:hypothetical protein